MSSRSDMEIVPLGFFVVTRLFLMSRGHCQYHTMGGSGRKPGNYTPPTPQLDASQKPWYNAEVRGVSLGTCVGLLLISWSKIVQVVQYCFIMSFTVIWLKLALLAMASILSIWPSRALSTCMGMALKVSLPCSFSIQLNGMHLLRWIAFNSRSILSHLGCGRMIVLAMPSSIQPRISVRVSQVPSSKSFFV